MIEQWANCAFYFCSNQDTQPINITMNKCLLSDEQQKSRIAMLEYISNTDFCSFTIWVLQSHMCLWLRCSESFINHSSPTDELLKFKYETNLWGTRWLYIKKTGTQNFLGEDLNLGVLTALTKWSTLTILMVEHLLDNQDLSQLHIDAVPLYYKHYNCFSIRIQFNLAKYTPPQIHVFD